MTKRYTTIEDARTAFTNSGVENFLPTDDQAKSVVEDMWRNDKSPEKATADVLDLDAADRRAIGVE